MTKYYTLTYDTENRPQKITNTDTGEVTTFTYDADGRRVMRETVTKTVVYVGSHYEKQILLEDVNDDCEVNVQDVQKVASRWKAYEGDPGYDPVCDLVDDGDNDVVDIMKVVVAWGETCPVSETVKYYTLGGRRVAIRKGEELYYLFSDHLGSSSVSYRVSDGQTITQRYYPWGTIRPGPDNALPTDHTFTGQKLDESTGLMYYGARYYDAALGRFVQADTIVPEPGNPQALNRYSYVYDNPLRYTDPTGHQPGWIGTARRLLHWATAPWQPWYDAPIQCWRNRGCLTIRGWNNSPGDEAIKGLEADIQRAAQDAGVPTILLAAALHHQGASPK